MDYCFSYLTPEFDEHMKATRMDPRATLIQNILPLMRVHWADELPYQQLGVTEGRVLRALILLLDLRSALWKGEALLPQEQAFWDECVRRFPNAPIIQRFLAGGNEREELLSEQAAMLEQVDADLDAEEEEQDLLALALDNKLAELGPRLAAWQRAFGYQEGQKLFEKALDASDPALFELLMKHAKLEENAWILVLGMAARRGQTERVRIIHQRGTPLDGDNQLALRQALEARQQETVAWLVQQGGNALQAAGDILYSCCAEGKAETVKDLLRLGVSPNMHYGACLRIAAGRGHYSTVQALLDHGADVHVEDDVALSCAVSQGHTDVARLLIERGATLTSKHTGRMCEESRANYVKVINHVALGKFTL